jgi:hypothetical protein
MKAKAVRANILTGLIGSIDHVGVTARVTRIKPHVTSLPRTTSTSVRIVLRVLTMTTFPCDLTKDPLMTYLEGTFYPKPTGGDFLDRLIERKQMSTKTTFKCIALVAVAALGLGTLSSYAPAAAAVNGETNTVAFASTSVELGQDAVLILFQQYTATGAAGTDTLNVKFDVTQNAFTTSAAGVVTPNAAPPKVFIGSTPSILSTTTTHVARGYALGKDLDGFPATDIAAGAVNVNNTQSVTGNDSSSITVTNVNAITSVFSGTQLLLAHTH